MIYHREPERDGDVIEGIKHALAIEAVAIVVIFMIGAVVLNGNAIFKFVGL